MIVIFIIFPGILSFFFRIYPCFFYIGLRIFETCFDTIFLCIHPFVGMCIFHKRLKIVIRIVYVVYIKYQSEPDYK